MIPSLSKEVKLASVTSYEFESEVGFGHIAYHLYALHTLKFVIIAYRAGEEQFVVFTSVKGACGDIHIEFLSHQSRLIVYRQGVFIHSASCARLLADVVKLRRQAVRDIHHRGRTDACLTQLLDNIATSLSLQLALDKVFLAYKIRIPRLILAQFAFLQLLVINILLAFEQLQSHISCSKVA